MNRDVLRRTNHESNDTANARLHDRFTDNGQEVSFLREISLWIYSNKIFTIQFSAMFRDQRDDLILQPAFTSPGGDL